MSGAYVNYPWLFKGAYAIYRGTSKVGNLPGELDITDKTQVEDIDTANRRVRLSSHSLVVQRIWPKSKKISETDSADWIVIGERTIVSKTPAILERECEGQTSVEGLGVRRCIIQQYAVGSSNVLVFWDKEFSWPLQYIIILRYKTRESAGLFETILDSAKESAEFMAKNWDYAMNGNLDLQSGLKKSRNVILRESSIVISLKETNIPFVPPPPPPPPN